MHSARSEAGAVNEVFAQFLKEHSLEEKVTG